VKPIVFDISDKAVKKAGLDYWGKLDLKVWESLEEFLEENEQYLDRFFFATTKTNKPFFKADFKKGDFLFFGGESTGLPIEFMKKKWENAITLPMGKNGRSLNLAMSVCAITYAAIGATYHENYFTTNDVVY
jgi:tRNA (cytidine/uridine-2'-O-)-methyltransferase